MPALTILIIVLEPEEAKPEPEVTVGDQIRLEHAAHEIDTSAGFQPKSFVSSASHKRLVKEAQRLNNVGNGAGGDDIVMTEKDAVKCAAFASVRHWALVVNAEPDTRLGELILARLAETRRHG